MISTVVNYYDILEVHQEVSAKEIKRSFRTLIKKYHPDIHGQNKLWAESKTKVIIQAYKTLSDSATRERYDRLYSHHLKPRDYIDYKFLLAEAYEKLGQHEVAIEFYEFIYELGKDTHHSRHLAAEIKERIRNIYCRKLTRSAPPDKALGYYEKVLKLK